LFGRRDATSFFNLKRSTFSIPRPFSARSPFFSDVSVETPSKNFSKRLSSKRPFVCKRSLQIGESGKRSALDASTLSVHYTPEIATNNAPRRKKRLFFHIFFKSSFFCQTETFGEFRQKHSAFLQVAAF